MNRFSRRSAYAALTAMLVFMFFAACGGKETVASRSAQALQEAQRTGNPMGSKRHGGHPAGSVETSASSSPEEHAGTDHSKMSTAGEAGNAGTDHSNMPGMQTSTAQRGQQAMAGMDHGNMPGVQTNTSQRGQQSMAGMDHSDMPGMQTSTAQRGQQSMADHSNMPSANPRTAHTGNQSTAGTDHSTMPGMQSPAGGTSPTPSSPPSDAAVLASNAPSTLALDPFDAPVAVSVAEAIKSVQGVGPGHQDRTPGRDRENRPTPAPGTRDGTNGEVSVPSMDHSDHQETNTPPAAMEGTRPIRPKSAAKPRTKPPTAKTPQTAPAAAIVYTCLMHPEVRSGKPGKCPKCGMALVRKK